MRSASSSSAGRKRPLSGRAAERRGGCVSAFAGSPESLLLFGRRSRLTDVARKGRERAYACVAKHHHTVTQPILAPVHQKNPMATREIVYGYLSGNIVLDGLHTLHIPVAPAPGSSKIERQKT